MGTFPEWFYFSEWSLYRIGSFVFAQFEKNNPIWDPKFEDNEIRASFNGFHLKYLPLHICQISLNAVQVPKESLQNFTSEERNVGNVTYWILSRLSEIFVNISYLTGTLLV